MALIRRPDDISNEAAMIRHPSSRSHRGGVLHLGGRDPLADAFGRRLDDDWHWFRRVGVGAGEPIDAVVVGPGGSWTLTAAGERGRFARRNGHWYRWNRSTESWVPWDPQPITDARLAARRLTLYLERAGLPGEVRARPLGMRFLGQPTLRGAAASLAVRSEAVGLACRCAIHVVSMQVESQNDAAACD